MAPRQTPLTAPRSAPLPRVVAPSLRRFVALPYNTPMLPRDPDPAHGLDDLPPIEIEAPLCAVFRRHLRSLGQKYTPERARVLDALIEIDDVFTTDTLLEHLRRPGSDVSKATVYRTLKLLEDAGIVQRVFVTPEKTSFLLAYGKRPRDLLINTDTGEIIPVEAPELIELRERICGRHNLVPRGHRLQIYAARAK